jgi:hypothetical protein
MKRRYLGLGISEGSNYFFIQKTLGYLKVVSFYTDMCNYTDLEYRDSHSIG